MSRVRNASRTMPRALLMWKTPLGSAVAMPVESCPRCCSSSSAS